MFSMCSELTPRAPIPDGRMEQITQPWLYDKYDQYEFVFDWFMETFKEPSHWIELCYCLIFQIQIQKMRMVHFLLLRSFGLSRVILF